MKYIYLLIAFPLHVVLVSAQIIGDVKGYNTPNDSVKILKPGTNESPTGIAIEFSIGAAISRNPTPPNSYPQVIYAENGTHIELTGIYMFTSNSGAIVSISDNMNSYNTQAAPQTWGDHLKAPDPYNIVEYAIGVNPSIQVNNFISIEFRITGIICSIYAPTIWNDNKIYMRGSHTQYFGYNSGVGFLFKLNRKISLILKLSYTNVLIPYPALGSQIFSDGNFSLTEPTISIKYKL